MSNGWTPERRQRQSKMIRQWKPWEKSTGPTTTQGKKRIALNAQKDGHQNLELVLFKQLIQDQQLFIQGFIDNA